MLSRLSSLLALAGLLLLAKADDEVVSVLALVRHGARAPNHQVVDVCPGVYSNLDQIREAFGAEPTSLTVEGLNQNRGVGAFLRERYIEGEDPLTGGHYSTIAAEYHFRGRPKPRHLIAVNCAANGLFPEGTGPEGYPNQAQPVAIYSDDNNYDNLLNTPPAACVAQKGVDNAAWTESSAAGFYAGHDELLAAVGEACGLALDDFSVAPEQATPDRIKLIGDLMDFMDSEGLPLPLSEEHHVELRDLSFRMLDDKLFGTEEKVVYWSGEFPEYVRGAVESQLNGSSPVKVGVYTTSRELIYSVGHLYGFDFDYPPLPHGKVHPGTTILFETVLVGEKREPVMRTYLWNPQDGDTAEGFKQVQVTGCALDCPVDEFFAVWDDAVEAVGGDYREQCASSSSSTSSDEAVVPLFSTMPDNAAVNVALALVACVASAIGGAWVQRNYRLSSPQYSSSL